LADSALSQSLAALARFFVGDGTLAETLQRVTDLTTVAVPPADLVGITMLVEGRQRTAVFTDEAAPEIDQAQYDTGDGPCLAAFTEKKVFAIPSVAEDGPWPAFRAAAAAHGIRSTLSLPLTIGEASLGAMNLYSRVERAFSDEDQQTATQFASQAAIVLGNTQAYWEVRDMNVRLGDMLGTRAVIDQAKGILMAAQHIDEDAAFAILIRASQRENVKLRDIARRIVERAVQGGPASEDPDPPMAESGRT
jgi:GAF domain-containing protein